MNLPAVTPNELLDQNMQAEERRALWAQAVVRAIVERDDRPVWFPVDDREEQVQAAS